MAQVHKNRAGTFCRVSLFSLFLSLLGCLDNVYYKLCSVAVLQWYCGYCSGYPRGSTDTPTIYNPVVPARSERQIWRSKKRKTQELINKVRQRCQYVTAGNGMFTVCYYSADVYSVLHTVIIIRTTPIVDWPYAIVSTF